MTTYELYLAIHVVAAMVWLGAGFLMALLGTRAWRSRDPGRCAALARDSEWLGLRLFLPSSLVVLVAAVLLMHDGGWDYGAVWVWPALVGFGLSTALGVLVFGPGWARAVAVAEREGADAPAFRARLRRLLVVSWFDVGLLLAIVLLMTAKPTGDDAAVLGLAAVLPPTLGGAGLALVRGGARVSADVVSAERL